MSRVHVIGAGVAGLACAVELAAAGRRVALYDAAPRAGGRCRSFHDDVLDCIIDNGNHLLLSGNWAALRLLDRIGARDRLIGPDEAVFPFLDVRTGQRWTVRPNAGPLPWWIFDARRRVPGTHAWHYLGLARLAFARDGATVADVFGPANALFEGFWDPFTVAVLNTAPDQAALALLRPVIRETFARGGAACCPLIARTGLSDAFAEPALAYLRARGADVRLNARVAALARDGGRVAALGFARDQVALAPGDTVVLAVPPTVAGTLLPGLAVPEAASPIVNVHYRLDRPVDPAPEVPLLGIIGGDAQWLFFRDDIVSVTVSAADDLVGEPAETVADRAWADVSQAIGRVGAALPRYRVVKEKRATFLQTPDALVKRPGPGTDMANLFLAGDWTDTGLPATIEGAVRSGFRAADLAGAAERAAAA